jgi:hypothetical protein
VKKVEGRAGRESIVVQVYKNNSFTRLEMQKNPRSSEGQPPSVRRPKAGVALFCPDRHRNRKFSTTSLVHGVEYHIKTNTGIAIVELVC